MAENDLEFIYDCVVQIIRSPEFRNPIKEFIDENCGTFIGVEENTFEQGSLHKEFTALVENLLEIMIKDMGITEEMFSLASKKGLNDEKNKKYFEQLIAFTNYNYFKNLMTKRNLYLEELTYKQMLQEKEKEGNQLSAKDREEMEKNQKLLEENEIQCALKMSLAVEEEEQKLKKLEEEQLEKAIKESLLMMEKQKKEENPLIQTKENIVKEPQIQNKIVENKEKEEQKLKKIKEYEEKMKCLKENDEKKKEMLQNKLNPVPILSTKANENLNKKLNEFEQTKAKKLQEYREMILKMKKEKREKEENEVEKDLTDKKLDEDEQKRLSMRKLLAEKLKGKIKK